MNILFLQFFDVDYEIEPKQNIHLVANSIFCGSFYFLFGWEREKNKNEWRKI